MVYILDSFLLIEMVENDDFVFFILVLEKLGNCLVLFDSGAWEIQGFLDMVLLVLVRVSQIEQ